ncbi:MAG TPA: amino acid adenylation domain-containing protein, partial [Thermoanaerobaculia bacterium]|nr:amino acid adenylation domain-containing protein [Thermoanaerobaculia bacterium]
LPVDPDYPAERIAYMLADSGAVAVVAREELRGRLPAGGPPVLVLDAAEPAEQTGEPDAAAELARADGWHPERLAYVIYTSGSTGRPKGVELTHRGLANLVAWHRAAYRPGPEDRATLLAGPGFDAAVWELWPVLASGAVLCVPPEELRAAPEDLLAWLAEAGITLAFLATPLAEAALDAIRSRGVPEGLRLRALLTGGDRLHRPPPEGLPFAVVNHYGPTESTVVSTAGEVAADSRVPPPIGGPIAGLGARVLDRWLGEVPVGVPGELCVAGRGLARGYRGRPAWTAGAFVPDPAGEERGGRQLLSGAAPGARLYRTGDLARWLPDGRLEFLGRIDNQVQVRGFRVELGEIEAVLAAHPAVREAVVLARTPPAGGEARLIAYPVPADGEASDPEELRAWLARRLPDYMVPRHFVPIPEVPLTPNGKIDRAALPEPDAGPGPGEAHVPPRTPLEELVAGVWAEVLGVERVGATDDFFHLGGHSLLATRVLSRLRDALGVEVPLAALFEAPTVAGLAAAVEGGARPGEVAERPADDRIPRRAGDGPAPLSFTQERLWFLDRLAPGTAAYVIGRSYRIRFPGGELDAGALARALSALVARHEALRTRFAAREEAPVQVIDPAGPVPLPVVDLSGLGSKRAAAEARRLAEEHSRRPFDLAAGPVLRSALVRLAPDEHHWLVALHHIASDGWSMAVFHREIGALYRAARVRRAGRPPAPTELPELAGLFALPIQYADFAAWQRERLQGQVVEDQLAFWRDHLAGAPALLELPADRPRPPIQRFRGAQVAAELPAELLARLDRLARTSGATRFMVLLAAFVALLARTSRQDD